MTFNRVYPYLLLGIAVAGLYLQWSYYKASKEECECNNGESPGPIGG